MLQHERPGWFVMWGSWARAFTAWHLADPCECRPVHAKTPDELRSRILHAELELWRASYIPHWQSTPQAASEARQA